ncbi:MAG: glycosyltransferase family 4 protein [Chloroflexia bacterium]
MLRVLYVNSSAELLGGAERCLMAMVGGLGGRYAQIVALPRRGPLAGELERRGAKVYTLGFGVPRSRREISTPTAALRIAGILPGALRLARLIAHERIDLVHTNTSVPLAGAFAARLMRRPHIWHVREVLDRPRPIAPALRSLIPRLSDRVVCISETTRAPFTGLPPALARRFVVMHDGIEIPPPRTATVPAAPPSPCIAAVPAAPTTQNSKPKTQNPNLVGMIARVTPWKGHALFLDAAARVAAAVPDARFVIVGGCPPAYADLQAGFEARAASPDLAGRVCFTGQVELAEVRALLGRMVVLVHPTGQPEPLGLVMLEAMASGCPVVATAHGGALEIISDGTDGLLAPPDADSLASAVLRLLSDPPLRARLAAAARTKVEAEYSLDTNMQRLAALYDCVANAREHSC